jgi:hypothetical protein
MGLVFHKTQLENYHKPQSLYWLLMTGMENVELSADGQFHCHY